VGNTAFAESEGKLFLADVGHDTEWFRQYAPWSMPTGRQIRSSSREGACCDGGNRTGRGVGPDGTNIARSSVHRREGPLRRGE
jgi:hypothetical protein